MWSANPECVQNIMFFYGTLSFLTEVYGDEYNNMIENPYMNLGEFKRLVTLITNLSATLVTFNGKALLLITRHKKGSLIWQCFLYKPLI